MAEQFEYGIRLSLRQLINAIEVIGGYGWICIVVGPFPCANEPSHLPRRFNRWSIVRFGRIFNNSRQILYVERDSFESLNIRRSLFKFKAFTLYTVVVKSN